MSSLLNLQELLEILAETHAAWQQLLLLSEDSASNQVAGLLGLFLDFSVISIILDYKGH